jgi:hypothetical protein
MQLTDDELDTLITTRLALSGIDLTQLPETPDPVTGSPTQAQAMESLRTFLAGANKNGVRSGGVIGAINSWEPPAGSDALAQQASIPLEYPSITVAWTDGGLH